MESWQLPDYISDLLPPQARELEILKSNCLQLFHSYGYELAAPPLLEFARSLLVDHDSGLEKETIQVADQISGQRLGIRSDITTQITRIDAHLSHAQEIRRFCYAGPTLKAIPQSITRGNREPLQLGAEIYGYLGIEADIELIELMLACVNTLEIQPTLSLGHIGIFNCLVKESSLPTEALPELIELLNLKATSAVDHFLSPFNLAQALHQSFVTLSSLYGENEILSKAKQLLIKHPDIETALNELTEVASYFKNIPLYIELAELRDDRYHTGLLYGVHVQGHASFLTKGGRYNGLGRFFGQARAATGFSLDLKDFLPWLPKENQYTPITISFKEYTNAADFVAKLRKEGEVVIVDYSTGHRETSSHCLRQIKWRNEQWTVVPCIES
jgi:ATP phosphoribosyltransferase, regulatory subunit